MSDTETTGAETAQPAGGNEAPAQPTSLLASVQDEAPKQEQAADQPASKWAGIVPDKFVKGDEVNIEALAKSYTHLEKRMGSGDLPPESPDAYKLDEKPEWVSDEDMAEEAQFAHEIKLSNDQFKAVMGRYADGVKTIIEELTPTPDKCMGALLEQLGGNKEALANEVALARKAFAAYAPDGVDMSAPEIGNNPTLIRILAKIGAGMGEDKPVSGASPASVNVAELYASEAYNNPRHPQHQQVMDQIAAAYKAKPVRRFG